jgi:hypothetical protein
MGTPDMSQPAAFIWYELMTPDPDGARRFYGAVTGCRIDEEPAGGMDYRMIATDRGFAGGVLGLSPAMVAQGTRPMWVGYLHVTDVDAAARAITGDGGQVLMPPTTMQGVGRMAMLADPQGAPFYVMTPQGGGESTVFAPGAPGHVGWNEHIAPDLTAAWDFYVRHFGWHRGEDVDIGPAGIYRLFTRGADSIGGFMRARTGRDRALWRFYIGVPDIDAAHEAVRQAGGTILFDPMEVPGGQFVLHGTDPHGADFALIGPGAAKASS